MKKVFCAFVVVGSVVCVKAQEKKFTLGAGPVASFPIGNLGNSQSFGLGGELQGTYGIEENIRLFAQAGYQDFLAKSGYTSASFIPVLVGAHYVNQGLIAGVGIGYGSYSTGITTHTTIIGYNSTTFQPIYGNVTEPGVTTSGFAYSPQVGYTTPKLDVIATYTATSVSGGTLSFIGVKAYFKFLTK